MALKVLLCEDYHAVRELLVATLESDAYDVVSAADGDACVECWRSERPAIVVLDVKMPGRSGPEVLAAIQGESELAATPVIMLTGATEASAREAAARFAPARYLTKPFSPLELVAAVEEIGERLTGGSVLPASEVERLATNEVRFRRANERVERVALGLPGAPIPADLLFSFVCECGEGSCVQELRLTLGEYEEIRRDPTRFAVVAGHQQGEVDRVVARSGRFVTVEKVSGRGREIALQSDPRKE